MVWVGIALILVTPEFRRFDFTWLVGDNPLLVQMGTLLGVSLEVSYPFLVWNKRIRPWLLMAVVMMHLGIDLALGLTEFGLTMVAANLSFVSGAWLRSLVSGRVQPLGRVLYDGYCPRCRTSMALLSAGDPDHVLEPVDLNSLDVAKLDPRLSREATLKAMHVVQSDGKVKAGYDAVMAVMGWIPLTWAFSLLRFVPGVSWIGRKVYDAIAASRPRDEPCTDETCGIHPPKPLKTKVQGREHVEKVP